MKKFILISTAALTIVAAVSCNKEKKDPSEIRTTINATMEPVVKTALGVKDGNAWPNYWKTGDVISINGSNSDPLGSGYDGKSSASFTFGSTLNTPYYAAYPASAISSYSNGTATVTFPAVQFHSEGTYDPDAFIMGGRSETTGKVALSPLVSVVHLTVNGDASISNIRLTGETDAALSGAFTTDFTSCTPKTVLNTVELVEETPVALPAEFFICVPAGLSGSLTVELLDSFGGSMSKTATIGTSLAAGTVYSPEAFTYDPGFNISISAEGITSSTAVICWGTSPEAAYTIGVYSDEACSTPVSSYAVPAGDSCWGGVSPRFCISGLASGTTYYVKVTNTGMGIDSNVLPVTTSGFEIVEVGTTPAAKGDVILAEDFGELCWDCDMIGSGAGWFPTAEARTTSFTTLDVDSYQAAATSSEKQLSSQTEAIAASRLIHWAQGENKNLYIHPGYIKLVGSSKVTHLVTPAFDNIPEGFAATVEVELTASAYYSASSSSFATTQAVVAVQTADCGEICDDQTNTLDLTSNKADITLTQASAWNKYTVTLENVANGNRLAFGAADGVSGNDARMNISDIKVTVKDIYEVRADALTAELKGTTTSSAAFTWTHANSPALDLTRPYTIAIYRDSGCIDLALSLDIPAGADCWDGKQPCFVFGGLESGTNYYFRAEDTSDADNPEYSNVVEATTGAFTNVAYNANVGNAAVGDIILAENFNEWGYGTDETMGAAGFYDNDCSLKIFNGKVDMSTVSLQTASSTGRRFFHITKIWETGRRIEQWGFAGNSSSYLRAGYLRMTTTSSGNRTHLVSPKLAAIPDGKFATIEVTAKMLRTESDNKFGVLVQTGTMSKNTGSGNPEPCYKLGTLASDNTYPFDLKTKNSWETCTVTIENISNGNSLAFGSIDNISGKNRFFIGEISVKLIALYDEASAKLNASKVASSSSTLVFQWTEGVSPSDDVANAYTAQLFSDADCTNAIRTFVIPAGCGAWENKTPKFVFGGLAPSTDYWFKVTDTTNNLESNVVKGTTDAFTNVTMPAEITGTGVVLAEDFGELCWDFDYPNDAMGYYPAEPRTDWGQSEVDTGKNSDSNKYYGGYHRSGGGETNVFSGYSTAFAASRLNDWYAEDNIYVHPGYLKLGTSSGGGWLHTPAFTVPEGKTAVITVTLTAGRYSSSQESEWAVGVEDSDHFTPNSGKHTCSSSWMDKESTASYQLIEFTNNNTWVTKSVSGLEIHHGERIVIGAKSGASGSKRRFQISDVTVEVTELKDN